MNNVNCGLEGVVVAHTRLSDVDGERGELVIAGQRLEAWALHGEFEERMFVLFREAGAALEASADSQALLEQRRQFTAHNGRAALADAMDALRAGLAQLPSDADDMRDALCAIGRAPGVVAAWAQSRGITGANHETANAEATVNHAAWYSSQLGLAPTPVRVRALSTYWNTVMDHGMNASTFAARVVASTGSDMISSLVAGVGALKGPLHGGAPGPVLDMLDEIGSVDRAKPWIMAELDAGRRIMGMGHRIYRVRDPRAAVLERAITELQEAGATNARLSLARAVERAASDILRERKPDRPLCANVEFYTAVLLDSIGIPRELFAATFALGRMAGWAAHVMEQRRTGKLIRPASIYIGTAPSAE
jgi:citrate synthase